MKSEPLNLEKLNEVEVETEKSYAEKALAAKKCQSELYGSPKSNIAERLFS